MAFGEELINKHVCIEWANPAQEWDFEYHIRDLYMVGDEVWVKAVSLKENTVQVFRLSEVRFFEYIIPGDSPESPGVGEGSS